MDNKRLISFVKSAELGSLSAAADALGYTPSAVSQLVASLEQELGIQLLVRTTRGVYTTSEGEGLVPIVKDYLSREQLIYDYVNEVKGLTAGSLTITAYPSVAGIWLPEIVKEFRNAFPHISINILECIRSDIFLHLDRGDSELGFLAYADPMPYEWIPLAEERLVAILPPDHRLADAECYPISEIENDEFILSSSGQEPEILNMLDRYNLHPEIKFTTYDTPVNIAMVQSGLGVSICNELSVMNTSRNIKIMPIDPPEKVTFGIAFKSYDQLTTAAKRFLEYSVKLLTQNEN